MIADDVHRVLTGSTRTRLQLWVAGLVVIGWISIDIIQFADWLNTKINPAPIVVRCQ